MLNFVWDCVCVRECVCESVCECELYVVCVSFRQVVLSATDDSVKCPLLRVNRTKRVVLGFVS